MLDERGRLFQQDNRGLNAQINTAYFEQICLALRDGLRYELDADNSWVGYFHTKPEIRRCLGNIETFLLGPDAAFSSYDDEDITAVQEVFRRTAKYLPNFLPAQDAETITIFIKRLADDGALHCRSVQTHVTTLSTDAAKLFSHPVLGRRLTNLNIVLTEKDQDIASLLSGSRQTSKNTKLVNASTQLIDQALTGTKATPAAQKSTVDVWQAVAKNITQMMGAQEFKAAPSLPLSFFGKLKKLFFSYRPDGYQVVRQPNKVFSSLKDDVIKAKDSVELAQAVAAFKAPWFKQGKLPEVIAAGFEKLDDYVALVENNRVCAVCQGPEEGRSAPGRPRASSQSNAQILEKAPTSYVSFEDDKDFQALTKSARRLPEQSNQRRHTFWNILTGGQVAVQRQLPAQRYSA